jgi:hypothetical protein
LPLPSLFVGRFVGTKFDVMSTTVNVMTLNTTMFTFFNTCPYLGSISLREDLHKSNTQTFGLVP